MPRYLITQSLVSSWAYMFDCMEGNEESAQQEFLRVLRREPGETTDAMRCGIEFENAVYSEAAGERWDTGGRWESGITTVASKIKGAQVQVKLSQPLTVGGVEYLVYGILDALRAGTIYDVKFTVARGGLRSNDFYGKYLDSPQHPFYFHLVPEALDFKYLLSDGEDVYEETYLREQTRPAADIISEFIRSITDMGLLPLYQEKWIAR